MCLTCSKFWMLVFVRFRLYCWHTLVCSCVKRQGCGPIVQKKKFLNMYELCIIKETLKGGTTPSKILVFNSKIIELN